MTWNFLPVILFDEKRKKKKRKERTEAQCIISFRTHLKEGMVGRKWRKR